MYIIGGISGYIDYFTIYNFGAIMNTFENTVFRGKPLASALEIRVKPAEEQMKKMVDAWVSENRSVWIG